MKLVYFQGWRAYEFDFCSGIDITGRQEKCLKGWCLKGIFSIHLHRLPPSPARCLLLRPSPIIPPHTEAPNEKCSCGYYALLEPDYLRITRNKPIVWIRIKASGFTILTEELNKPVGCRMENFIPVDLFWPPFLLGLYTANYNEIMPDNCPITSPSILPGTLSEILPGIAKTLGLPLHKEPLASFLNWGYWEYIKPEAESPW